MEAHLFMGLAVGDGAVAHRRDILRLAAAEVLEGQDHRHERLFPGCPGRGEGICEDEALIVGSP